MEMTITRSLNEVKLLDKRINKKLMTICFITANKKSNKKIGGICTPKEFNEKAKADYESIKDLIKRRKEIKALIVMSNATTDVQIGEQTYKVADAIERKNSIQYEKDMLQRMVAQYSRVKSQVEQQNEQMEINLDRQLEVMLGTDKKKDGMKDFTDNYRQQNSYEVIDGLNLQKEIEALEYEIDEFENNVDFVLSEHNSITKIVIPD